MVLITWEDDTGRHREELRPEGNLIGRSSSCDIHVNHSSVSRRHAEILWQDESWIVRDLGSSNGTRHNGILISHAVIEDGDEVLVGVVPARIVWQDGPSIPLERKDFDPTCVVLPDHTVVENLEHPKAGADDLPSSLAGVVESMVQASTEIDVLRNVAEKLLEALPVAGVSILLHEAASDELIAKIVRRREPASEPALIPTDVVRRSFLLFEAMFLPELPAEDDEAPSRSGLCSPMLGSEGVLGVVIADWPSGEVAIGRQHLHFLGLVAGVTAALVERTRARAGDVRTATVRERLLRHHAPASVDALMDHPDEAGHLALAKREVTLLCLKIDALANLADEAAPKEVALLLNRLFSTVTEGIFDLGGTLGSFDGSRLMAIFGAPWEQKDHAIAAVHCAWRLQETIARLNKQGRFGRHRVALRIGIHTGPVLAGDVGSSRRMEYAVLGSTVTLVSCLVTQVAGPGKTIIGPDTYPLVRDVAVCERLGLQILPGIHEPVWAYSLTTMKEGD